MKKQVFFAHSIIAVTLVCSFYWASCQKEFDTINTGSYKQIQDQTSADRGGGECGRCGGDFKLTVSTTPFPLSPANPQFYDWHVKLEERICPNDVLGWSTILEYDDDDPKAIGPGDSWGNVVNLLSHDKFYRLTVTNESLLTSLYFYSRIRESDQYRGGSLPIIEPGYEPGTGYLLSPGEARSFIYQGNIDFPQPVGLWRSNCGCPWSYNCGGVNEN